MPFLKGMNFDVWSPCLACQGVGHVLVSTSVY